MGREDLPGVEGDSTSVPSARRQWVQRAIAAHIEARRSDPDFRQRLQASIERNREILERLAR